MNFKNRRRWKIIRDYSIGWTLAFVFLCIVRGEGTQELGSTQFEMWESIGFSFLIGPVFGSISGYAQVLTEEYGYKRMSLSKLLVFRVLFVMLFLFALFTLGYFVFGQHVSFREFVFEPGSFAIFVYIISVDFFMLCLRQVNLFLGKDNLANLIRGKFYTPREEERIFMFLDLQSSTAHAENLGHIMYSKMIQDCFNDLGVVIENESEIYQYVGDEAILTWKLDDGLRNQNCIQAFYNFKRQIKKRQDHYMGAYGFIPHFKAGLNSGIVTTTEVGKYKKEIAYHGDTINVAARIQAKCNDLNQELLVSGNLVDQLNGNGATFEKIDSIELRGKEQKVLVYAAQRNEVRD